MVDKASELGPREPVKAFLSHNFSDEEAITSRGSNGALDAGISTLSHMTSAAQPVTGDTSSIVVEFAKLDGT